MGLSAFLLEAARSIRIPDERDYGEGIVLWQAANVTNLKTAYHSVDHYPFIVFHYPPVYHLFVRLASLFTANLLGAGRAVSTLSFLAISGLMGALAWRSLRICRGRAARLTGTLCAGMMAFSLSTCVWGSLMRVDSLAVALTFAGLSLYISSRGRPAMAFAAFTVFVLAVYTKQTMLAAPFACLIFAWLERPRLAWQLLGWSATLGGGTLLALNWATSGNFILNVYSYLRNPFTVERLVTCWNNHLGSGFVVLLAAALTTITSVFVSARGSSVADRLRNCLGRDPLRRSVIIFGGYLAAALLMSCTVGKEGSNVNYFFEVDAAVTLLSGQFLGWVMDRSLRGKNNYPAVLAVSIAALSIQALPGIDAITVALRDQSRPERDADVTAFVRSLNGPVYSENMTILMRAGKAIPAEPAIITLLTKMSKWDENRMIALVEDGRFAAVLVNTSLDNGERFTPPVARAIREHYPKQRRFGFNTVYLPEKASVPGIPFRRAGL